MKGYEVLMVLRPDHEEERNKFINTIEKYPDKIGNLDKSGNWGLERLAYPINEYYEGIYMLLTFQAETLNIKPNLRELDNKCKYSDACLRHMIIRKGE